MVAVKEGFLFDRKEVLVVLLYGSVKKDEETPRKGIDICIAAPCMQEQSRSAQEVRRVSKKYEVGILRIASVYAPINHHDDTNYYQHHEIKTKVLNTMAFS